MKTNLTELVFVLDRSGSMSGLEDDTIGGFNSMLEKQQALDDPCLVTTILFDHEYFTLHNRVDIHKIAPLTRKDYEPRGSTALLDALGKSIQDTLKTQKFALAHDRAEKVLFVVITDGYENSSRYFNAEEIKHLVEKQQFIYDWEFIFLGANIDAISTAADLGFHKRNVSDFVPDGAGVQTVFNSIGCAIKSCRISPAGEKLSADWSANVRKDFAQRGNKQ